MNSKSTDQAPMPAEEMRAAAAKMREVDDAWLSDGIVPEYAAPLADLLEFLSGSAEFSSERGRVSTIQDEYALAVARAINGTAK